MLSETMKAILLFLSLFVALSQSKAQLKSDKSNGTIKNSDTTELAIQKYYHLGVQYKEGKAVQMDYQKSCDYFQKAANMGDSQSVYAIGYMHYKGLGCSQDYALAAKLFSQGAYGGRDNSMYFYGLCWRNGYGLTQNEDSAQYWLKKAAALGYQQAIQELKMPAPEDANEPARTLVQQIHNAALPENTSLNQFNKIIFHLPAASVISGDYEGYLISYDWSGKHVINNKKLRLFVVADKGKSGKKSLRGEWVEEGLAAVNFYARLTKDSLYFDSTEYRLKDHYSDGSDILYKFKNAFLSIVQKRDSVYLVGNVEMFSPDRREPSKPLFVALVRSTARSSPETLNNSKNSVKLNVYPNPFTSLFNVEFNLIKESKVEIQLYTTEGVLVYRKTSGGILTQGRYVITILPGNISSATYILRLLCNGTVEEAKIIKL